jgi:hypothetical protein
MQDSKIINRNNELNFTLGMKSCHFTRNQTYQIERWRQCKNNNVLHEIDENKKINDVG